jgi:cathepsin L
MSRFAAIVVALAFVCAVAAAAAHHHTHRGPKAHELTESYSFEKYVLDFGKSYSQVSERERRAKNFAKSLKEALEHNKKPSSYKKGVNRFSDWDEVELQRLRGGRHEAKAELKYASAYQPRVGAPLAKVVDYRKHVPAVVTAVKDQGQCGDCWAHAVTEAIESSWALATGELFVLSQQQITACTPQLGSCYSCGGSFPDLGYEYAVANGITEEWIYPFESYNGSNVNCSATPYISTPVRTIVNISGYTRVGTNSQHDTEVALNELGPLSILVDASSWSSYESGIFDGCDYSQNISLDHAVNVVGYGSEAGQDYWIVRNSWAASWGELGYIRLAKPSQVQCGWNVGAAHTYDCTGSGPAASWSCGTCGILFGPAFPVADTSSSSAASSASGGTPVPTPAPVVDCSQYSTCYECTAVANCGFCSTTGLCEQGNATGSLSGDCSGSSWDWTYYQCPATPAPSVDCAQYVTCGQCTAVANCGFCSTTGLCEQGNATGSLSGDCSGSSWDWVSGECGATPSPNGTPSPQGNAAFVIFTTGELFPQPPAGYVMAGLADVQSSAFLQLYNGNKLNDLVQSVSWGGCCTFAVNEGYLQYNGSFVLPYSQAGVNECADQLSNPVTWGTLSNQWFQTIQASLITASTNTTGFCYSTQNTFAIFKQN